MEVRQKQALHTVQGFGEKEHELYSNGVHIDQLGSASYKHLTDNHFNQPALADRLILVGSNRQLADMRKLLDVGRNF